MVTFHILVYFEQKLGLLSFTFSSPTFIKMLRYCHSLRRILHKSYFFDKNLFCFLIQWTCAHDNNVSFLWQDLFSHNSVTMNLTYFRMTMTMSHHRFSPELPKRTIPDVVINRVAHYRLSLLLQILHGHSFFSSPPQQPMTSDYEGFSIPDCIHCIIFLS